MSRRRKLLAAKAAKPAQKAAKAAPAPTEVSADETVDVIEAAEDE